MSRDDDSLLGRWSRRKRAAERDTAAPPVEENPQGVDETPPDDIPEAELLEKLGLPDPDTLRKGDDFQAFLKTGVPDYLKKRALRRLWLSNPALANLDGLLDYGDDFTDAAVVPEVVMTAYKVGRGFLKDALEDAEDAPEKTHGINQEIATAETAPEAVGPEPAAAPQENVKIRTEHPENTEEPEPQPRRMTFRYD